MTRSVYFFGDGGADGEPDRKDILGGKGASLAAMTRANMPVPPGFTIAADRCAAFLANDGTWPDGLADEIRDALARLERTTGRRFGLGDNPLLVSVRSGAAVSMPGMMDTILNCPGRTGFQPVEPQPVQPQPGKAVPPTEGCATDPDPWEVLVECIEAVFNSWNSPRATAYRRQRGIRGLAGTAVTVQAMFPSRVSGVVFTTNPNDPEADEMIVESSYGLGESVVSGQVHPDNFVLDRKTLAVKRRFIGHKSHVVLAAGDTSRPDPDAPSLTERQVAEIARIALDVENLFGFRVDVEWGLAEGRFALLQARPVRPAQAHSQAKLLQSVRSALRDDIQAGRGPWVLHNLAETLPHPTPLTWSVQRRFMSGAGGLGTMYRLGGFEPTEAACREQIVTLVAGRVYMDVGLAPELFFENYPFNYDMDLLRCDPDAAQLPPTLPRGTLRARMAAARRIAAVHRGLGETAENLDGELRERTIPDFVAWCENQKALSLAEMPTDDLVELWRLRERRVMDEFAPQSLLPSLVIGMALAELRAFLAEHFWDADEDADELAGVLAAPPAPDRTLQANAGLFAVAQSQRSVEKWLEEHGHRGPDELDLASPRWHERPDDVAAMAHRLKDGQDPMALHGAHLAKVESRARQLRARLGPRDAEQFDRLVDLVKRYIPFREDGKYYLMLGYDLLRDVALEAGRRLELGDDVFFMTVGELHEALTCGVGPEERIAERRARYHAETRVVLPRVIDADTVDALGRAPVLENAESYPAHEISAGVASGPVRIVTSLQDAGQLGHGYVLVCRSTDPAWTPLFVNAAALVLECGGALSHGAVVAREMGIPAVVLPDATALLTDVKTVTVDGHQGRVLLCEAQAGKPHQPLDAPRRAAENDVRIEPEDTPPPPGRRERLAARARNIALLVWGAYFLAMLCLPGDWLYLSSLGLIDRVLWPLVIRFGMPATVAIAAAALALLTMVGQRLLTDNRRLRQAKLRAGRLTAEASRLDRGSPRRAALARLAAPVNVRLLGAAMAPIGLLLGPMIVTFFWFPARVDPASWSPPPGTAVKVVAVVDSRFSGPVTLIAAAPGRLAESTPATRAAPPVRVTLEKLLAQLRQAGPGEAPPADIEATGRSAAEVRASLEAYLGAHAPGQGIMWEVRVPDGFDGTFPVTVRAGDAPPLTINVVLGRTRPPAPTEISGDSDSTVNSARVVYPPPARKRIFWAPLAAMGCGDWDAGWLLTYLAVYLPIMFALRWILKIA